MENSHSQQVLRIKKKLEDARQADENCIVFGTNSHKYVLHSPAKLSQLIALEKKYTIQFPECYKAFVLYVGNGGVSFHNSGAGPFYGIYPLGKELDDLANPEIFLSKPCILYPDMDDAFWHELTEPLNNMWVGDKNYYDQMGKIFSGILPLGTQGCSFLHGLILNGPYKGRVVNLEIGARQKPKFAYENNFLDWYERWLDEVLSRKTGSWFGYLPHKD